MGQAAAARLPAARAQTVPRPWNLWSPWLSARQHVRVSGGEVGGGENSGFPCPRHHANTWKVELTPGGMPRAQGVGICWHGIVGRTRGPTTTCHSGLPLTRHRGRSAPPSRGTHFGGSPKCPSGTMPITYHGPSPLAPGRTWKIQTLCWTPARLEWFSLLA